MIYVSSACVKNKKMGDSIKTLIDNGFKNIELSGGTDFQENIEDELLQLKEEYNLQYLCHNYFPAPREALVVNLASLDDEIYSKSLEHFKGAIKLSKKLGAKKFGLHAGFLFDIGINEIGKDLSKAKINNREECIKRFCDGYLSLQKEADGIEVYIENNVLSNKNFQTFSNKNPLLMTDYKSYLELKELIDFKLLLDVGHLKVSCHTLGLDFEGELNSLLPNSDYLHISDNDGEFDQNKGFNEKSELFTLLKKHDLNQKVFTFEIEEDIKQVKNSSIALKELLK